MNFAKNSAQAAFRTAQKIKEHMDQYCLAPDRIPVSVDDLAYVVGDMFGVKIEMCDVDYTSVFVNGMVERFIDKRARISVKREQSNDMKRFVATKELCQIAIGSDLDFSTHGTDTLEAMVFAGGIVNGSKEAGLRDNADAALQSEYLAEFVAYEVLYPVVYRLNDKKALKENNQTIRTLANHYDIPSFVVGRVLSERYEVFKNTCLE